MSAAHEMPDQVAEPGTEIAPLDRPLTAALVFKPGGVTSLLQQITTQVRATEVDVSTPAGRAACKRLAAKVARSKTTLDDMGKAVNDDARKRIASTDADRRTIRETLDSLKAEVLSPLEAFEAREERRVKAHQEALAEIPCGSAYLETSSLAELSQRLAYLRAYPARDWEEFGKRAADAIAREITLTTVALEEAQVREAEIARVNAERARIEEEQRQEAERLQAEREARIAAEAAEAARVAAEAEAERQRAQAAQQAEDRRLAALAAEQARLEEIEAEHRRQVEAAAQAERDRAEAVAAEHARQVEAAEQVRRVADRERLAAEQRAQRAEQERIAAEERAAEVARQAEVDRAAAAERAEQDRQAAVLAEQQRVARVHAAEQAAAAAREADKTHKAGRNNEVVADLMLVAGLGIGSARTVVVALASRKIRHTTISY